MALATSKFIVELVYNSASMHRGDSVLVVVCERTREVDELFHDARMIEATLSTDLVLDTARSSKV